MYDEEQYKEDRYQRYLTTQANLEAFYEEVNKYMRWLESIDESIDELGDLLSVEVPYTKGKDTWRYNPAARLESLVSHVKRHQTSEE